MSQSTENQNKESISEVYNPILEAAPVVKDYQKPNVDESTILAEIPSFQYNKPTLNAEPTLESNESQNASRPKREESQSFNESYNDLTSKEKKLGAEMTAETIIDGYEFLCGQVLTPLAQIKNSKVEEKIASGEISLAAEIIMDAEGNSGNVRDFVNEYNQNIAEALAVSDSFKDEVREPLIRIAEKKGLAMTDEQRVMFSVGKDISIKSIMLFQLKSSVNIILANFEEQTKNIKQIYTPAPTTKTTSENSTNGDNSKNSEIPTIVPSETVSKNIENSNEKKSVASKSKGNSNFVPAKEIATNPTFGDMEQLNHMQETVKNYGKSTSKRTVATKANANKSAQKTIKKVDNSIENKPKE